MEWHKDAELQPSNRTRCLVKLSDGTIKKDYHWFGEWSYEDVIEWALDPYFYQQDYEIEDTSEPSGEPSGSISFTIGDII